MARKRRIDVEKYAEIFKALGHPIRLQMVVGLSQGECNVNRIVERLGIPQSTASQHLAVLRGKGIVEPRKEGVITCYRVVDDSVMKIIELLRNG